MTDDPDPDRELGDPVADERLRPAEGFRDALARRLAAEDPGYGPRPARLWLMVAAFGGGGLLLIVVGALSAVGAL